MLNQVAETTGHPLLTPLGQSVFPVDTALLIMRTTQDAENLCLDIVKMLEKNG